MTEPLRRIGTVDVRYLQLVRDAGELLIARVFDTAAPAQPPVRVHATTLQLLQRLQLLPRPTLPALLTLFVWGLAHCSVAVRESRDAVPQLIWHYAYAEGLTLAWQLVLVAAGTTWINSDDDVTSALSVLACIPRAALIGLEQFDKQKWPEILDGRRKRRGGDKLEPVRVCHNPDTSQLGLKTEFMILHCSPSYSRMVCMCRVCFP